MAKEVENNGLAHNAIAQSTVINGNIVSEEDFRIDGTLEGDISVTGKLVIGPKGTIHGKIACENIEIMGTVEGNVIVAQSAIFRGTAIFTGELQVSQILIEPGAQFNGSCSMK